MESFGAIRIFESGGIIYIQLPKQKALGITPADAVEVGKALMEIGLKQVVGDVFGKKSPVDSECPTCQNPLKGELDREINSKTMVICPDCYEILAFDDQKNLIKIDTESWQLLGEAKQKCLLDARLKLMGIKAESNCELH